MIAGRADRVYGSAAGRMVLALIALATSVAYGQSDGGKSEVATIDELKRAYLSCDRAAMGDRLQRAGVMQCSIVYEELKRRAFGGDFEKLLAWSKAHRSRRNAGQ